MLVRIFFLLIFGVFAGLNSTAQPTVPLNLPTIFSQVTKSSFVSPAVAKNLLLFAAQKGYNVFDLMNETGLYLKARQLRLSIWGSDLREAAKTIRLGDTRVDTLIPLQKLVSISLGAKDGTDNELEVILSDEHSGFLELGDFYIQKRYGFRELGEKRLDAAYGIRVKSGWMTFDLDKIERVPDPNNAGSLNYIAIHLKLFPRPKKWLIEPVRLYTPQELAARQR